MKTLIIPAAGKATRLRPLSSSSSKAMIPVAGKPIISHILDQYGSKYDNIIVVYGENKDLLSFLNLKYPHVKTVKQEDPQGPLHAIFYALNVHAETEGELTIWLGDTIVTDFYEPHVDDNAAVVIASDVEDWTRWCMIDNNGTLYDKPIDKPEEAAALVGIYCFNDIRQVLKITNKIIYDRVKVKGEFQISQLLNEFKRSYRKTNHWYDCGELHSLYASSAKLTSRLSCEDNYIEVNVEECSLTKMGTRCGNERYWYDRAPNRAKPFIPNIYEVGTDYICMEFLSGSTLQNMLIYEDLPADAIEFIMKKVFTLFEKCFHEKTNEFFTMNSAAWNYMWIEKNTNRVNNYKYDFVKQLDIDKYVKYVEGIKGELANYIQYRSFVHGDLHLGNLLFNSSTSQIKMIDPRGEYYNNRMVGGDNLYDVVKLYQSIYGEYIWIHSGVPKNQFVYDTALNTLDKYFSQHYDVEFIKKLVPVMMGSVLKFHTEERQQRIWNRTLELI